MTPQMIGKALKREGAHKIAAMNLANVEFNISEGLTETYEYEGYSQPSYVWMLNFQKVLANHDALERREAMTNKEAAKSRRLFEELIEIDMRKGTFEEVETAINGLVLTATPDLNSWYLIKGNAPASNTPPTEYCIFYKGSSGALRSGNNALNDKYLDKFNSYKAGLDCISYYGLFNYKCRPYSVIKNQYINEGYDLVFQGQFSSEAEERQAINNGLLSIYENSSERKFKISLTTTEGATVPMYHGYHLNYFEFTPKK